MHHKPPREIRVIVNPTSGRAGRHALVDRLARGLRTLGFRLEVCTTTGPRHATELARDAGGRVQAVIVVGGDGTVREVAAGLLGTGIAMLIAPGGTENLVARHFGFRPDVHQLISAIESWRTLAIDVAYANACPFLVVTGFGFDAEVVLRVAMARNGHITHASYAAPLWRTFWEHRFPTLHVEADGEQICHEPAMAFVGNIPRYAMGLPIFRYARPDDGLLDLCLFRCHGRTPLLLHAWRTIWGRHVNSPGVMYRQVRALRVWSDEPVPVELDGDVGGAVGRRVPHAPGSAALTFTGPTATHRMARAGLLCNPSDDDEPSAPFVQFSVVPGAVRICLPPAP